MTDSFIKYRGDWKYNTPLLFVAMLFLVPLADATPSITWHQIVGFGLLSSVALLAIIVPPGLTIEVGPRFVRSRLFGYELSTITTSTVISVDVGTLQPRSLRLGDGLRVIYSVHGRLRKTQFSQRLYGKAAIEQATQSLKGDHFHPTT